MPPHRVYIYASTHGLAPRIIVPEGEVWEIESISAYSSAYSALYPACYMCIVPAYDPEGLTIAHYLIADAGVAGRKTALVYDRPLTAYAGDGIEAMADGIDTTLTIRYRRRGRS